MDIDEFLLTRIDEDRERAEHDIDHFGGTGDNRDAWIVKLSTRTLAECEGKRRITELHTSPPQPYAQECDVCCYPGEEFSMRRYNVRWPCDTLCLLAAPYSDHPGYNPEWSA